MRRTVTISAMNIKEKKLIELTGFPVTIAGIVPAVLHPSLDFPAYWQVTEPRTGCTLMRGESARTQKLALELATRLVSGAGAEGMADLIEEHLATQAEAV